MNELIGKKKYQDRSFWLALGLIAILSFIVIIISAEDGTLHLGAAIFPAGATVSSVERLSAEDPAERQHFSFLPQGKTAYLQARQIPGLSVVEFTAIENIKDVDVFLSVIPAEEASFHGAVYSAFRIQSVPEAAFSMKFTLRIPREVPGVPGLNAGEMQLFADGKETPLVLEGSTESYTSYGAQVSGMGTFIIGKAVEEPGSAAEGAGDGPLAPPEPGTETPESAFPTPEDSAIARQPAPGLSFMEHIKEFFSAIFSS